MRSARTAASTRISGSTAIPTGQGIQLDEVSFPIILAWRLWKADALGNFDPYINRARAPAGISSAKARPRRRNAGKRREAIRLRRWPRISPALICAAEFFEARGDSHTAEFVRTYADFLESHVEKWTVTNHGTLVPGIARHYIRINPASECRRAPSETKIRTRENWRWPTRNPATVTSTRRTRLWMPDFWNWCDYGIRQPDDPLMVDSLKVIDAVLKVDTPNGPCWKRYNHDGYGQRTTAGSFDGWGVGTALAAAHAGAGRVRTGSRQER